MTDFQFHSSDCPMWHPEKFVAAGPSSSKCWCQRWSNLADWNISPEVSNDDMLLNELKKEALLETAAPKQTENPPPLPVLQTDAILGSNLWGEEAMKLEGDLAADLEVLWKKLDEESGDEVAVSTEELQESLSLPSTSSESAPLFLAPVDVLVNSPGGLSLPSPTPIIISGLGTGLQSLPLTLPKLDDLTGAPLELDPVALFEESFLPTLTTSPSPPLLDSPLPAVPTEADSKVTTKRRGRPPGKASTKRKNDLDGDKQPKKGRKRSLSIAESLPEELLDPTSIVVLPEDVKPIIKKSKKKLTPEEQKDDGYWARRQKNNLAAKRSRDIKRLKENQIAVRAAYLESENKRLTADLDHARSLNDTLRRRLEAYEGRKR